jgi:hypothetical protein
LNGDEAVDEEATTDEDIILAGDAGDDTALAVGVTEGLFKLMVATLELCVTEGVTEGLFKFTVVAGA